MIFFSIKSLWNRQFAWCYKYKWIMKITISFNVGILVLYKILLLALNDKYILISRF